MKVIIGNGKVSNIIKDKNDVILSHKDIEIANPESVLSSLQKFPPNTLVINTAAKINLEWCESNKNEAELVNVYGALNIAHACQTFNHRMVHISSGCIFDGEETGKVYTEEDKPNPASWYAYTKSKADQLLTSCGYDKILIVRPRQLISPVPNPTNMLTKFMSIEAGDFIDSPNSITCIEDMKEMIDHLISKSCVGIYNTVNVGYISPYEIAVRIREEFNPQMVVNRISYLDYIKKLKVKRVNTLLSVDKMISTGYTPKTASNALEWCLKNYGKIK